MLRGINRVVKGVSAVDGAGVRLTRVLGPDHAYDFDPFLMLDSFDSADPRDYVKGFPTHPHRGIETITYLVEGRIDHEDSLGNKGTILSGQSQWMTAGRGILHQEMPKASERMLGVQLWLNLSKVEKMAPPAYMDIKENMIPAVEACGCVVRVISGRYGDVEGVKPRHIQATLLDVAIPAEGEWHMETPTDQTAFVFLIRGDAEIDGQHIAEKSTVQLSGGDRAKIRAAESGATRLFFAMARPLREPIAWGGPIVMNTDEELDLAFRQLRMGTFL